LKLSLQYLIVFYLFNTILSEFEADEEGHSDEDSENEDNGKDANLIEDEKGMVGGCGFFVLFSLGDEKVIFNP